MRLLLDQDIYAVTLRFLRNLGQDVVTVAEIGCSRESDEKLLHIAGEQHRIFITRDRDFGNLVFVKQIGSGVIYLRMLPSDIGDVHEELKRVLTVYSEDEINQAFIVVGSRKHRFRKILR